MMADFEKVFYNKYLKAVDKSSNLVSMTCFPWKFSFFAFDKHTQTNQKRIRATTSGNPTIKIEKHQKGNSEEYWGQHQTPSWWKYILLCMVRINAMNQQAQAIYYIIHHQNRTLHSRIHWKQESYWGWMEGTQVCFLSHFHTFIMPKNNSKKFCQTDC